MAPGAADFDERRSFAASGHWAAAVLCEPNAGIPHLGIMYREPDGELGFLHLGAQDYLSSSWRWPLFWATPDAEPELLRIVGAVCRQVEECFNESGTFPYGFAFGQSTFDVDGQLQLGPGAQGLTCATFVLAVFNAAGVTVVDEDSWPIRTDEDLAFLARLSLEPEMAARLRTEIEAGIRRIRPGETMGACCCELPASFEESVAAGATALATMRRGASPAVAPPTGTA